MENYSADSRHEIQGQAAAISTGNLRIAHVTIWMIRQLQEVVIIIPYYWERIMYAVLI